MIANIISVYTPQIVHFTGTARPNFSASRPPTVNQNLAWQRPFEEHPDLTKSFLGIQKVFFCLSQNQQKRRSRTIHTGPD